MTVRIRLAGETDASAIAAIYRPYVTASHFSFEEVAPELMKSRHGCPTRSIRGWWPRRRAVWLAMPQPRRCAIARPIGGASRPAFISPRQPRDAASLIGCWARISLCLSGRASSPLSREIALPNDASVALHEKLGFTLSGIERGVGFKLGEWVDVGRWQRTWRRAMRSQPNRGRSSRCCRHPGLEPGSAFCQRRKGRQPGSSPG